MPTMVPTPDRLPSVLPTDRLNERGMALNPLRGELRTIANLANIGTVAWALMLSFGVVTAAGWINTWWAYVLAFFVMGGSHVRLNILGHEAAHRLLFTNRRANDWAGRWLLSYPTYSAFLAYRRAHFSHHRDEMGPEEPDLSLYAGYPVAPDSWRRKMRRDATGSSALKLFRGLFSAARSGRREAWYIIGFQLLFFGTTIAVARPIVYLVWILSWSTLWRVTNRVRAIAEHGGMTRSKDRRETTHVIRQTMLARMWIVPYNTGWHLAHHVDMGVPWRNLPRLHEELVAAGWVTPDLEYPSYRAFIRDATSG
jgi:fatty acid desaturase